jgi:PHD/YefM family antitoxin component YafN of YafNO toxin-antitoxin module
MSGIQYVVDERGEQQAVIIDLKKYRTLWEDFADRVLAARRAKEPRESLADVRKRLLKTGKLHA